jgi:NDP-sugar pyrophosphorylase family protein
MTPLIKDAFRFIFLISKFHCSKGLNHNPYMFLDELRLQLINQIRYETYNIKINFPFQFKLFCALKILLLLRVLSNFNYLLKIENYTLMPRHQFDSIIFLGPSVDFYPLVTSKNPKFSLPFLNKPLLNHCLDFVGPYSTKIFILCLEEHRDLVRHLTKNYILAIEIISSHGYEGMAYNLNIIKNRIKSENLIICKADSYNIASLKSMLEAFVITGDDLHVSFDRSIDNNPVITVGSDGYLYSYNTDDLPYVKNQKLTVSSEYILKDFYLLKSSMIMSIPAGIFGFKNHLIPYMLQTQKRVRLIENSIFQIRTINDYILQLDLKNRQILSGSISSLLGKNVKIGFGSEIQDSIIGNNCTIGSGVYIKRSIIMKNATIGDNCVIEHSIVGFNSTIFFGSSIITSKITHNYKLTAPIDITSQNFHLE